MPTIFISINEDDAKILDALVFEVAQKRVTATAPVFVLTQEQKSQVIEIAKREGLPAGDAWIQEQKQIWRTENQIDGRRVGRRLPSRTSVATDLLEKAIRKNNNNHKG